MNADAVVPDRRGRLARITGRIAGAGRSVARAVRRYLRREAWSAERRRALLAGLGRRRLAAAGAAALALVVLVVFLLGRGGGAPAGVAVALAREGGFSVTVVESGSLQALRSVTYASTIQSNQAKIVALIPEGKLVQKGDLLILFDSAPFEEEIRKGQALLAQAQADLEKARQDEKLQLIQNREELAAARQKLERSELELKDVLEGSGKLREEEAASAVADAERKLARSESALADLRPLLAEGFITKMELERAEQEVERAREELALARRRRSSLLDFGRPLELSQARSDAALTRESAQQLAAAAASRLEQRKAAIAAAHSRVQEASSRLALAQQQLARTEVRADVPGIVVYRNVFFGSEPRKPQVGDQVWANQPLLVLPDISKMVVETRVRETDVHKVADNQRVNVRVDAYPDLRLTGAVTLVGTLAQEERDRRGAKFFGVTVQINESDPRLRPRMTAQVEIHVEERPRAVHVPLEAVFEKDGRSICYLIDGRRVVEREVVLGPSNADFVVVESGLRPGDRVCLREPGAPPSDFGSLVGQ